MPLVSVEWRDYSRNMNEQITMRMLEQAFQQHRPALHFSVTAKERAAVAIIAREKADLSLEILMIQRATHHLDPWSGHMAFPGGREEAQDHSLEETARRETFEEVNLKLRAQMLLGRLDDLSAGHIRPHSMSISPFVYAWEGPADLKMSHEVARALWLPLDYLLNSANVCPYEPQGHHSRPVFPALHWEGCMIWGLSYQMLCMLGRLLGREMIQEIE